MKQHKKTHGINKYFHFKLILYVILDIFWGMHVMNADCAHLYCMMCMPADYVHLHNVCCKPRDFDMHVYCLSGVCILAYCPVYEIICIDHGQNTDGMSYAYCCAMVCWFYYPFHPRVSRLILFHLLTKVNNKFQIIFWGLYLCQTNWDVRRYESVLCPLLVLVQYVHLFDCADTCWGLRCR